MKLGRNDPCPCGSGKKYKRCCMSDSSKSHAAMLDDIEQIAAMNPNLSLDELNVVTQKRIEDNNNRPNADFCGLSPNQMFNWLYAPLNELTSVKIKTPDDLSASPVMRYLALMVEEAIANNGSFKATTKGNLPAKLVKRASERLPEFAVAAFETPASINEFTGSNEDKFNALHYTRVLAEIAGIIKFRSGSFHIAKTAQKQYQTHGLNAFFVPMLQAATHQYNWSYFDAWEYDIDLRTPWLFMLWRIQSHGSLDQLTDEMCVAFPHFTAPFATDTYFSPKEQLDMLIESRVIERFLQFWGFVTVNPKRYINQERLPRKADIQPLLRQAFEFSVSAK